MSKGSKYKSENRPKFKIWDNENNEWYQPTFEVYKGRLEELLLSPVGDLSMRTISGFTHESLFPDRFEIVLDEPYKVKVPVFVAEWFEAEKHNLNFAIFELCAAGKSTVDFDEGLTEFEIWFYLNNDIETLIRMQDGYEVEKPKYYVELPFEEWNEDAAELKPKSIFLGFNITSDETRFMATKEGWGDFKTKLDEETIKSIDERFWPFAVPAEKVSGWD